LDRSDWSVLGYALMSSHVHLAMLAGDAPAWHLLKPLHTSFAVWINRTRGTLGPVFADRATTVVMEPGALGRLLPYIHNNPVRAGIVCSPEQSTWTSHRAYLAPAGAPPWLAVQRGLVLCGFDGTPAGRVDFHRWTCAHAQDPRNPEMSGTNLGSIRTRVRRHTALPVEISSPWLGDGAQGEVACEVHLPAPHRRAARWDGDLGELIQAVCTRSEVSLEELCSSTREARVVQARRLAVVTGCRLLQRPIQEVAAHLSISANAATKLLRRADRVLGEARLVAGDLTG
jgi:hypothetical protein